MHDRPSLAVWSELFQKHRGLTFKSVGSPSVIYKVRSGEDAVESALTILEEYYSVLNETKLEKESEK